MNYVFSRPVGRGTEGDFARPPGFGPVAAYIVATTFAGASTGAALAALGMLMREATSGALEPLRFVLYALLAIVGVAAVVLEMRGRMAPLPERRRQVPTAWLRWHHRSATAAAFGLMIGSGVMTYLNHAAAYALAGVVFLAPSFEAGVGVGVVYGLTRGTVLLLTWTTGRVLGRRVPWDAFDAKRGALSPCLSIVAASAVVIAAFNVV